MVKQRTQETAHAIMLGLLEVVVFTVAWNRNVLYRFLSYLKYLTGRADDLDRVGTKVWGWKINHPDLLLLWSRVRGWVFRRERLSTNRSLLHILRRPCDLLVRRRELICWAGVLLTVPAFHSFNWLVTRSQARKSSCTGKSSISPPDGRLKTDAMEWFPAYVDLHIAHAHTALPLILLECTCVTSEFIFRETRCTPQRLSS